MSVTEIEGMSRVEKLAAMECLWDSLVHDGVALESPEWHEDKLTGRREKIESGSAKFVSLSEVRERFAR